MTRRVLALACAIMVLVSHARAAAVSVLDFGAKADGLTLDSRAFNAAIEHCASAGGGVVSVPAGRYLCGSIRLKSNIELNLEPGAVIVATADKSAYDKSEHFGGPEYQDGGHTYFHNSLIWGEGLTNVSITGRGMIDGEGLTRRDTETAGNPHGGSIGHADKAIALKLCSNVLIRDVTIFRGGHFAIIVTGCDNATIDNVTIDTNRDGIDIDCCRFVTVSNCKVNTPSDDAIVLKSSYALKRPVPCEQVMVTNCLVTGFLLGTYLSGECKPAKVNWVCGRIKLGTESNGGFRNITISNITCLYSSGLAFEVVDQGLMDNIVVTNVAMRHVHHYPIYITTGCRNRGPKERKDVSTARRLLISNVVAEDCDSLSGIHISGMEGTPVEGVTLRDIDIRYRGGVAEAPKAEEYPELGTKYPEIAKFLGLCPASCLFARHVKGLTVDNVNFSLAKPDARPAVVLMDVENYRERLLTRPEGAAPDFVR